MSRLGFHKLAALWFVTCHTLATAQQFRATVIGGGSGTNAAYGVDLLQNGAVVGWNNAGSFVWNESTGIQQLPNVGGVCTATGANEVGDIVGYAPQSRAILWHGGMVSDIGAFRPNDINDSGVIVGANEHPVRWENGQLLDLGVLPTWNFGAAQAIANSGLIVGRLIDFSTHAYYTQPFKWTPTGQLQAIAISAPQGELSDMNQSGQTVFSAAPSEVPWSFWWDEPNAAWLPWHTLVGGINNLGQIACTFNGVASILNEFGTFTPSAIEIVQPFHPYNYVVPVRINDAGQILAYGHVENGYDPPILIRLDPVPENPTIVVVLLAVVSSWHARFRRV